VVLGHCIWQYLLPVLQVDGGECFHQFLSFSGMPVVGQDFHEIHGLRKLWIRKEFVKFWKLSEKGCGYIVTVFDSPVVYLCEKCKVNLEICQ